MTAEPKNHWPDGKVVIRKANSLIRGTALRDQALPSWEEPGGGCIRIARCDTGAEESIPLADAKAVFFVESFTGKSTHEDLHFYDAAASAPFLWARITFLDGEIMECLIDNSEDVVLSPAFFARPVDPEGNNRMVYIVKRMIKHFQVLAVRHLPASQGRPIGAVPARRV
jgi:hypothetical protein